MPADFVITYILLGCSDASLVIRPGFTPDSVIGWWSQVSVTLNAIYRSRELRPLHSRFTPVTQ
jgi:hypothetical protein